MGTSMTYLKKPVTDKEFGEGDADSLSYGYSTMQGWRRNQEDAYKIGLNIDEDTHLFGVFDGHGGKAVSQYCSQYIVDCIKKMDSYAKGDLKTALEECFLHLDQILYDFDKVIENTPESLPNNREKDVYHRVSNLFKDESSSQTVGSSSSGESSKAYDASSTSHMSRPGDSESRVVDDDEEDEDSNFEEDEDFESEGDEETSPAKNEEDALNGQTSNGSDEGKSNESTVVSGDCSSSNDVKGKGKQKKVAAPQMSKEKETALRKIISNELYNTFKSKLKSIVSDESFEDCGAVDDDESEDDEDDEYKLGEGRNLNLSEEECEDEEEDEEEDFDASDSDEADVSESFGPDGWMVPRARHCGTTAVVALVRGNKVYCANAGDSRCVLCRGGVAVEMSEDHKPDLPGEKKRIENAGSIVSRSGRHSRIDDSLNLSRAIGDLHFKMNSDLPLDQQSVIASPEIRVIDIDPIKDEFLILASDGIWSIWSSQDAVEFVRKRIKEGKAVTDICNELFDETLGGDPHNKFVGEDGFDNMTAIIVTFKRSTNGTANHEQKADKIEVTSEVSSPEDEPPSSEVSEGADICLKRTVTNDCEEKVENDAKRLKAE